MNRDASSPLDEDDLDVLLRAARDLSDGRTVDWEQVLSAHPELASSLRSLRRIDAFARACGLGFVDVASDLGPGAPSTDRGIAAGGTGERQAGNVWGPLRILERVGEGSFGIVYRAHDPLLDREVALKLRRVAIGEDPAAYRQHLEEARRLARVRHPAVLAVHGVEVHDGYVGMWTDFLRGRTLEQVLAAEGPFSGPEIARVGVAVARALTAVHESGLLHGDVKTANVMREDDGSIVLMDFGAGRDRGQAVTEEARFGTTEPAPGRERGSGDVATTGSSLLGTPLFMAPELFRGQRLTPAADVYSLGVVLYRLATGLFPRAADSLEDLAALHRRTSTATAGESAGTEPDGGSTAVVRLRELRPDLLSLAPVVERCLAADPAVRYQRAIEVEAAFLGMLAGDESAAFPGSEPSRLLGSLPLVDTRFVGRAAELVALRAALDLASPVVLLGPGGCGKSRLAREAAEQMRARFPDGAWWVDLSPISTQMAVASEVARALEIREQGDQEVAETLAAHLARKTLLLILDNAETSPAECAALAATLQAASRDSRIWITTRVPLGDGRFPVISVGPLGLPSAEDPARAESVRLFVDRAHRVRPDFVLGPSSLPDVARICRILDGIPLAIELAATRVRSLSVDAIAARLERGFALLAGGGARPERHQTLDACIDWSYRLLAPSEQRLLERLAVFVGGASFESIESVCADAPGAGEEAAIAGQPLVDVLDRLVETSLLSFHPDPGGGVHRYRMLEMVRRFAHGRLRASGEEGAYRRRHLDHYLGLAEWADQASSGPEQMTALDRMEVEHENLHHALDLAMNDDRGRALRLAAAIAHYWDMRGHWGLGLSWCRALLDQTPVPPPSPELSKLLTWAGHLSAERSEFEAATRYHERSLDVCEARQDRHGIAVALGNLGSIAQRRRDLASSQQHLEKSLAILRELDDRRRAAACLVNLGLLHVWKTEYAQAQVYFAEALAMQRERNYPAGIALALSNVGLVAMARGNHAEADAAYQESLEIRRKMGDRSGIATCLTQLGRIAAQRGETARARALLGEGLKLRLDLGQHLAVADSIEACARLAGWRGEHRRAVRLLAAALGMRESLGATLSPEERARLEPQLDGFRAAIGVEAYTYEWERGRHLLEAEAVQDALAAGGGETSG